jgi:micrococcal nuclease
VGAVVAGLVVAGCGGEEASTPATTSATSAEGGGGALEANAALDRVVDGDTIDVVIDGREERVRLIGIDTPEKPGNGNRPAECYGEEATAFTTALLAEGTPLYLERDVEPRDDFGRLLAYAYRAGDGLFVNLELARQGVAAQLTIAPNVAHADEIRMAVRDARDAGLGLWGACGGPDVTLAGA